MLRRGWKTFAVIAGSSLLLGGAFSAGARLQSLREADARSELSLALARCRQSQADAVVESLERTALTLDQNLNRLAGVADRVTATADRFARIQERPRETANRSECLADDDDAERMRVLSGSPD